MNDDRALIFGKIRSSLNRLSGETLQPPPASAPPVPSIAIEEPGTLGDRFREGVIKAAGSFDQVEGWSLVPKAIAQFLRQHNLAPKVTTVPDERLTTLDWSGIEFNSGTGDRQVEVGVSIGFAGLAETGTVAQVSGPNSSPLLAFAPATNIMVLEKEDIVGGFEGLWKKLRNKYGSGAMAPTINLVTGPSRTGDIEQVLYLGAHGPIRYHVIIVGGQD